DLAHLRSALAPPPCPRRSRRSASRTHHEKGHAMTRCLLATLACFALALPAGAQTVTEKITLFNGKNLDNFYTWLGAPNKGEKPYGKNNDPEKVFTVVDGAIRVSGKVFGCFT